MAAKDSACCAKRREPDDPSLADQMAEIFAEAQRTGLAGVDCAVGQYRMAQRRGVEKRSGC
jgi:hypothetical protein